AQHRFDLIGATERFVEQLGQQNCGDGRGQGQKEGGGNHDLRARPRWSNGDGRRLDDGDTADPLPIQIVAHARIVDRLQIVAEILLVHLLLQGERIKTLARSEEHTSELQSLAYLVCRLLLEKKKKKKQK